MRNPSVRAWWITGATMAVCGLLAPFIASGCSSSPRPAFAVDCSVLNQYDFSRPESYLPGAVVTWYPYGDMTPGALSTDAGGDAGGAPTAEPIEGGVCSGQVGGAENALVLRSSGHNDYGSGFGDYGFEGFVSPACGPDGGPIAPAQFVDASQYEGLSFWARNPGLTTKGMTLELTDIHSASEPCATNAGCVPYSTDAGTDLYVTVGSNGTLPAGSSIATAEPPPDACGNPFSTVILTTENWQLYTIPFSSFYQLFEPNRVPSGLDTAALALFTIVIPKENVVNLWIANLGFYRTKAPDAGP